MSIGGLRRDCECLHRLCTQGALKVHMSFCTVVSAGVIAPVDIVRHCGYRRFSNRYLCRHCERIREFTGISHRSRCVDDFVAAPIGDTHFNPGIAAVPRVTVRWWCCDCHLLSGLGACWTHRIGRRKARGPTAGCLITWGWGAGTCSGYQGSIKHKGQEQLPRLHAWGKPAKELHVHIVVLRARPRSKSSKSLPGSLPLNTPPAAALARVCHCCFIAGLRIPLWAAPTPARKMSTAR